LSPTSPPPRIDAPTYDHAQAAWYDAHHRKNLRTRITTWRERALLARALGSIAPLGSILDAPCGSGRFFPVLVAQTDAELVGADNSDGMLAVAAETEAVRAGRVRLVNASLFGSNLPSEAFDCVVCMRFMHHLALAEDRLHVLAELRRLTRRYLVVSLWVDGNLQARRRPPSEPIAGFGRRGWIRRAALEREFAQSSLRVQRYFDVARWWSMWRFYVLEKTS
jgi:SAM-dependent methyltransferase